MPRALQAAAEAVPQFVAEVKMLSPRAGAGAWDMQPALAEMRPLLGLQKTAGALMVTTAAEVGRKLQEEQLQAPVTVAADQQQVGNTQGATVTAWEQVVAAATLEAEELGSHLTILEEAAHPIPLTWSPSLAPTCLDMIRRRADQQRMRTRPTMPLVWGLVVLWKAMATIGMQPALGTGVL